MLKKAGIALYEDEEDNKSEDGGGSPELWAVPIAQSSVNNATESLEITSQERSTRLKDEENCWLATRVVEII